MPENCLRHWCSCSYLRISLLHEQFHSPLITSSLIVSNAIPRLSPGLSHLTHKTAYTPFTPSYSEQRLHPSYYRGCWHEVSQGFFFKYTSLSSLTQELYNLKPSSLTRHCWIRVSPIVQYSPLLPPVGVWAVSQSQCGWSSSQTSYQSSAWWAFTSPTT